MRNPYSTDKELRTYLAIYTRIVRNHLRENRKEVSRHNISLLMGYDALQGEARTKGKTQQRYRRLREYALYLDR